MNKRIKKKKLKQATRALDVMIWVEFCETWNELEKLPWVRELLNNLTVEEE